MGKLYFVLIPIFNRLLILFFNESRKLRSRRFIIDIQMHQSKKLINLDFNKFIKVYLFLTIRSQTDKKYIKELYFLMLGVFLLIYFRVKLIGKLRFYTSLYITYNRSC